MSFLAPWFLLLLLPVAALGVAALILRRRRDRYAVRFAALPLLDKVVPERPGWRRHLTGGLALLTLVTTTLLFALLSALTRPRAGKGDVASSAALARAKSGTT